MHVRHSYIYIIIYIIDYGILFKLPSKLLFHAKLIGLCHMLASLNKTSIEKFSCTDVCHFTKDISSK